MRGQVIQGGKDSGSNVTFKYFTDSGIIVEYPSIPNDITALRDDIKSSNKNIKDITILKSDWTYNPDIFLYEYKINNQYIYDTSFIDIAFHLDSLEYAYSIKAACKSMNGYVILYSEEIPTKDLICDIKITKEVT